MKYRIFPTRKEYLLGYEDKFIEKLKSYGFKFKPIPSVISNSIVEVINKPKIVFIYLDDLMDFQKNIKFPLIIHDDYNIEIYNEER